MASLELVFFIDLQWCMISLGIPPPHMHHTIKIILVLIFLSLTEPADARSEYRSFVDRALSTIQVPTLHMLDVSNIDWTNPDSTKVKKAQIPLRKPGPLSAQDPEYLRWYSAYRATQVANTGGAMMATGVIIVFGSLIYRSMPDDNVAKASVTQLFITVGALLAIAGLSLMISGSERARKYRTRKNVAN